MLFKLTILLQEVVSRLCAEFTPTGVNVSDQLRPRRGYSSWFTWGARTPIPPGQCTFINITKFLKKKTNFKFIRLLY